MPLSPEERQEFNDAFEYFSENIARVNAEAIAARIVVGLVIDWLVQQEPNPAGITQELADAIDRAIEKMTFVSDGLPDGAGRTLDGEVREMARVYAHQLIENAHHRWAGGKPG